MSIKRTSFEGPRFMSYEEYIDEYPGTCFRETSEKFLKDNASFIDY